MEMFIGPFALYPSKRLIVIEFSGHIHVAKDVCMEHLTLLIIMMKRETFCENY